MFLMTAEKKNLFLKIYFLVGSVAWLIGALVWFGGLFSELFQKRLITDEEYIASQMYYEVQTCEQPTYTTKPDGTSAETKKTPEEIATCKEVTMTRLKNQRAYTLKSSIITWGVRGTLFFLVFVTHLPWLRKQYKGTEELDV